MSEKYRPNWLEILFPQSTSFSYAAVFFWFFAALVSALVFIGFASLIISYTQGSPPPQEPQHRALINGLIMAGIIAPLLETSLLLWLVSFLKDFIRRDAIIILITALGAAYIHFSVGKNFVQVILIASAFGFMSLYAIRRLAFATYRILWWELAAIHSANNIAWVLLSSAV
jgi:hypothetical protein